MGLFDVFKKKAEAVVSSNIAAPEPTAAPRQAPSQSGSRPATRGPTFEWNETIYPLPPGWMEGSVEDYYQKLEETRERIMHAHEEDLPEMTDSDGESLDPEEVLIITKLGFQSGNHWESFRSWSGNYWSEKTGIDWVTLEFRLSGIAREKIMAQKAVAMSGAGGALEPVEGVSVKDWARINAGIAGGGNMAALLAQAGMDQAKWDRVNTEWLARMQSDTTFTIATEYGNAFAGASQGQYGAAAAHAANVGIGGDLGAEPISYERYVEIMEAQGAAADRGEDPIATLQAFGMSVMDFSNVSMFWTKKTQQEAEKYRKLYIQYSDFYSKKYRGR